MRRALLISVGVLVLGASAYAGRIAWLHRPAGVFALDPRDPPAPECSFVVQLDRASDSGKPVQFGDLTCPSGEAAVLRVGADWYALPDTSLGSKYGLVRRSMNNRAWVVGADKDFFRSDDGGETFHLLHLPNWDTDDIVHLAGAVEVNGPALEHLAFAYEEKATRFRRLRAVIADPRPTGLRMRWEALEEAWNDAVPLFALQVRFESDDGGRRWYKR